MYEPLAGVTGGGLGALLGQQGRSGGLPGLDELLRPLSYPQQALYQGGRGLSRLTSGEGTWEDALGMLPGAIGLGTTALTGGNLMAGSLAGGLAQGLGKLTGMQAFQAPEVSDLLEALGGDPESMMQQMALGMATDPLTYAGVGPGRQAGRALAHPPSPLGSELGLGAGITPPRLDLTPEMAMKVGALDAKGQLMKEVPSPAHFEQVNRVARVNQQAELAQIAAEQQARQGAEELARTNRPPPAPPPEMFPQSMNPTEFQAKLEQLYSVARDFEGDVKAGQGPTGLPMMRQRASLWDEILRGEGEFQNRARPGGPWISHEEADIAPLLADMVGQRTFTPQQLEDLVGHHMQNRTERRFVDPIGPGHLAITPEQQTDMHNLLMRELWGGEAGHGGLESVMSAASEGRDPIQLRQISDRLYPELDKPLNHLTQGRPHPEEAERLLQQLSGQGYPLNRDALMGAYQEAHARRAQLRSDYGNNIVRELAGTSASRPQDRETFLQMYLKKLLEEAGPQEARSLIERAHMNRQGRPIPPEMLARLFPPGA